MQTPDTDVFLEISSYHPAELPERPMELDSFYALSKGEQFSQRDKFFQQDFIQEYLEEKWRAELHNRDCFLRLYELFSATTEAQVRSAIQQKLSMFNREIEQNKNPYQVLAIDLKKYSFGAVTETVGWDD